MDFNLNLNSRSINKIQQIYMQLKALPHYNGSEITLNPNGGAGSYAIYIYKNGNFISGFYFYPQFENSDIHSIAIYGSNLNGHLNTISASKKVFGFDVDTIELVLDSSEPFVDIEILPY